MTPVGSPLLKRGRNSGKVGPYLVSAVDSRAQWFVSLRLFVSAAGLLLASGCCLHFRNAGQPSAPVPPQAAAPFARPPVPETGVVESGLEFGSHYVLTRFELVALTNGTSTNRPLVLDCFLPAAQTNPPTIIILPMLGGSYPLERFFAKYFARHGMASVIVHREDYEATPATAPEVNKLFSQCVRDGKRAIDWLETRPEFDASRLGVFGISMGAIKGALLTPLDPRIDASVLAMPAGDLPYILAYTTEHGISRRRSALLKSRQITEEELRAELGKEITCDPIRFAQYVDPSKVMLVLAAFDSTVPIKKGLELRAKMGKPQTIVVAAGHYTAALYLPYLRYRTVQFLKDRLKGPPAFQGQLSRHEKRDQ
jgi:dienelactone hydrolase